MGSPDSSPPLTGISPNLYPLLTPKPKETQEKDWVWISAIVVAVIGGLIAALGTVCIKGIFPMELLGGPLPTGITCVIGLCILAPAAIILLDKWLDPKEKT